MRALTGPGPAQRPPAGARRGMRTGTSLFLIAIGAILRFAVVDASPLGLNVHITGVILILVGILGMTMPRLARVQRVLRTQRTQGAPRAPRDSRAQRFPGDPRAQRAPRARRAARDPLVPRDRLRRWVRPGQAQAFGEPVCAHPAGNDFQPAPAVAISLAEEPPTLLDNILSFEHPLL